MNGKRRRWNPSTEQIEAAIDAATARIPLDRAAELMNIAPRTLLSFAKRLQAAQAQYRPPPPNGAENGG